MDAWIIGGIAGGTAALSALIAQRRGGKAALDVLPVLKERGPMTVPELQAALGLTGTSGRGKVIQALFQLTRTKQVDELPVPVGTPRAKKLEVRRYQVRSPG